MKKSTMMAVLVTGILVFSTFLHAEDNEYIYNDGKKITKPLKRIMHFEKMRSFPTNEMSSEKRHNAFKEMEKMKYGAEKKALIQAQQPEWRPIGPFSIGGRVKSIAVHPTESNTVYIGAAAGGIWKTIDGGDTWKPIFDFENGIGFGSICIDMNNPDIIYAATGEAVLNSAGLIYLSSGVFRSTDAGETWNCIGLTQAGAFSKFYVHPLNSKKLVGGVVGSNHGFYFSTDAGQSWKKSENFDKNVSDVSFNPNNEDEYIVGVIGEGIYYTSNSGATWEARSSGIPSSINRVSVQMAPSNPDILYCLLEEDGIAGIFKSTNKGVNWTRSLRGTESFFNGQGWYNNYIMVHPTNPNVAFAGGIDLWKTTNGGQSVNGWYNMTNGYSGGDVHVDHHCGAFNPQDPGDIWIGNDGGVYRSRNTGESFIERNNGLEITQFYGFDFDQGHINRVFGGTQDNGTLSNHVNSDNWGWVNGGDGFRTVLDHTNKDIIYGEVYSNGSVFPFKRNIVSGSYSLLYNGLTSDMAGIWDPPLIMHPIHNFVLYHGRTNLYYSMDNGSRWELAIRGTTGNDFTAIAVSPLNEEMVYAGDQMGNLFVTKNHFQNTTNTSVNGLVARTMTDIDCSHINVNTAVASVSGYGTSHLFKTTNAGEKWESIGDKLPDVPALSVIMHPENDDWIFVGTDIGVFATFNGGATWLPFGRKLPRTIISDVKILNNKLTGNYILRAATYGRSIWEVDIPNDIINEHEITSPTGGEILTGTASYNFSWYGFDLPVRVEISYDNGATWNNWAEDVNDNSIRKDVPNKESFLNRIRVTSKNNPDQEKISKTFTITNVKKGSILQNSSVSHVPYGLAMGEDGYLWSSSFYTNQLCRINKNTLRAEEYITIKGGDSLYTDLTIDKKTKQIYVHKLNSTEGSGYGGDVIVLDYQGNQIKKYTSPATNYPVGIEMVENDLYIVECRGANPRNIYITEPGTTRVWQKGPNPFNYENGPRGLCYDGERYLYQACTHFSASSGGVIATYLMKIDKNDYSAEVERIPLEGRAGMINCRGIEYDPTDKNFWITDFGGNIYKIAGFETKVDVVDEKFITNDYQIEIFPNPASEYTNIFVKSDIESANIEIVLSDALGNKFRKLAKQNMNLTTGNSIFLDAENLSSGIYYVTIYSNGLAIKTAKLMVVK